MKLTKTNVKKAIDRFYTLIHEQGYLVDFFEILDEEILIKYKKIRFEGYRGFEDHMEGKRPIFDEVHKMLKCDIEIKKNIAIVKSRASWEGSTWREPETNSLRFKALIDHTWKLRLNPQKTQVRIYYQNVESLRFVEGKMPDYLK